MSAKITKILATGNIELALKFIDMNNFESAVKCLENALDQTRELGLYQVANEIKTEYSEG